MSLGVQIGISFEMDSYACINPDLFLSQPLQFPPPIKSDFTNKNVYVRFLHVIIQVARSIFIQKTVDPEKTWKHTID